MKDRPSPPDLLDRARDRARWLWGRFTRRATVLAMTAEHTWRRSLQVRVVTLTLVVSSLLVGGFAYMVATRSTSILVDRAQADLKGRVSRGVAYTDEQLKVYSQPFEPGLQGTMQEIATQLGGGDSQDAGGGVVVLMADASGPTVVKPAMSRQVDLSRVLGDDLRTRVAVDGVQASQIRTAELGGARQKYLVYGSPVGTAFGQVELYYVAPLAPQDAAANQIRATVLATGVALVILLGLLAALVTRLVVTPVRVAARTAQRLSAGLLDQRMVVSGEDDLALLAASFNQMATNLQRQIVRLEEMSRLQRRFTSDVSHELRTPLTTVRMAADLMFAEREAFSTRGGPQRRAAADRARPLREPADRPAGDQQVRRRLRDARRGAHRPGAGRANGWPSGCAASPSGSARRSSSTYRPVP